MLLASKMAKPRSTPESVRSEFDFRMEVTVGDDAPTSATTSVHGGWIDALPHTWEQPITFRANFPDLQLQKPPVLCHSPFDLDDPDDYAPQPRDEPMTLRLLVQRRSDQKVAILLQYKTALREWTVQPRYYDNTEYASIGTDWDIIRSPPPWIREGTSTPLHAEAGGGRAGLYSLAIDEMYWAGPSGRWGGEAQNELCISGFSRLPPAPRLLLRTAVQHEPDAERSRRRSEAGARVEHGAAVDLTVRVGVVCVVSSLRLRLCARLCASVRQSTDHALVVRR